jgi:hypothetical protein
VRFELTKPFRSGSFQDCWHKPLAHSSNIRLNQKTSSARFIFALGAKVYSQMHSARFLFILVAKYNSQNGGAGRVRTERSPARQRGALGQLSYSTMNKNCAKSWN